MSHRSLAHSFRRLKLSRCFSSGTLFLVPTPIGNDADMTPRAIETLRSVAIVCCEDTRDTKKLFRRLDIKTRLTSFHDHNERAKTEAIIADLKNGHSIAVVSDAGTPCISDPGYFLVRECATRNLPIVPLPGPTAVMPAIIASGLPANRFVFEGFLPPKKGRQTRMRSLVDEERTVVLLEGPKKLCKTLRQLVEVLGADRPACVARELSKPHEDFKRGTLGSLLAFYERITRDKGTVRGECVVVVGGVGFRWPDGFVPAS